MPSKICLFGVSVVVAYGVGKQQCYRRLGGFGHVDSASCRAHHHIYAGHDGGRSDIYPENIRTVDEVIWPPSG